MRNIIMLLSLLLTTGKVFTETNESVKLVNFDKLWNYEKPDETENTFREILSKSHNAPSEYRLELLTQIARTQGLQNKFKEAFQTLELVKKDLKQEQKRVKVRYLLELGRVYNSSGDKKNAREQFLEAYEIGKNNNLDNYSLDAAHMMGIVEPPENQLEWSLKALKIAENSKDKRIKGWLGSLYNNIGWTYFDLKKYDKALELFQKGLNWRIAHNDENGTRIQKWSIGKTLRIVGKTEKAYKIQKELEKEITDKKLAPDGYVYEELGECLLIKGNKEEAKNYFGKAYDILSQDEWEQKNESEKLDRLKKLSKEEK